MKVLTGIKVKVKFAPAHAMKAQRGSRGIALLLFNLGARWGGWLTPHPRRFTPGKETRYPLYRRLDGPQGQSRRLREVSTPPGFPQTALFFICADFNDVTRASRRYIELSSSDAMHHKYTTVPRPAPATERPQAQLPNGTSHLQDTSRRTQLMVMLVMLPARASVQSEQQWRHLVFRMSLKSDI